uniref:Pre-mRNA splicing Prp18-interacting factor n=1 Tax=Tanacetum cinerariifolium TaxID=118510 RepID=A0A699GP18_TANCI|nr:hypothetical protein [Tanacetum cinerariifolium]
MTSFGYRLNPRYAIKECSSSGTLYTRDCFCSKGNVEDKILVPKPPKNCARCARCGHPVNGPYCQGCTLLREKLDDDLVTYFQNFQNTSESSDGSTNVVNAPRVPFVVKQDHGVNPPHIDECCCECGEALDGIICQQCTCKSYGKGAHIGYNCPPKVPIISNPKPCNRTMNNDPPQILPSFDPMGYSKNSSPCVSKPNFVDESSNNFNPPPQPPIYSCEFHGSNAQYGHYCTPQASFINPEPGYNQDFNFSQDIYDFQQQYLCYDQCGGPHETFQCFDQTKTPQFPVVHPPPQETSIEISHDQENVINYVQNFLRKFNRYSFFETSKVLLLAWDRVFEIKDAFESKQYKPEDIQELFRKLLDDLQNIHEELAKFINILGWNRPSVYDDDDDDVDYTIAITPVLSTEEPDNSLSMGDERLDTIPTTESNEVIKSSVEDLVLIPSESEGIPDIMYDVHLVNNPTPLEAKDHFEIVINSNDDYSSSDDDYFYYENIEYVEASPHDSEFVSLEVEMIVIPKDKEIEDDNLREKLLKVNLLIAKIEALKDNPTPSSEFLTNGNTTTHSDISIPEYEAFSFYDDHIEEISSGSTTTHSDISIPEYEAFSFYDDHIEEISSGSTTTQSDFTHEEFGDELAHIISPPEYDCFYFGNFPDLGELISSLNSGIRENLSSTTRVNLPVEDDYSPLLAYVVWIFLAYLTYPVIPSYHHSFGNEDTIFDPCITINPFYSFKPGLSHRCGTFKKFNTHRSHLNESLMEMLFSTLFPMDQ